MRTKPLLLFFAALLVSQISLAASVNTDVQITHVDGTVMLVFADRHTEFIGAGDIKTVPAGTRIRVASGKAEIDTGALRITARQNSELVVMVDPASGAVTVDTTPASKGEVVVHAGNSLVVLAKDQSVQVTHNAQTGGEEFTSLKGDLQASINGQPGTLAQGMSANIPRGPGGSQYAANSNNSTNANNTTNNFDQGNYNTSNTPSPPPERINVSPSQL